MRVYEIETTSGRGTDKVLQSAFRYSESIANEYVTFLGLERATRLALRNFW